MAKIFIFLAIVCVQLQVTQMFAYGFLGLFLIIEVLRVLFKRSVIRVKGLWFFLAWTIITLFMSRPTYLTQIQGAIEFFWLTLGLISALLITVDPKVNRESIIKIIMYTGVLGAALNVISYTTGISSESLIASPYAGTRAIGGFDSPNEMGAFYLMIFALVLGMFVEGRVNKKILVVSSIVITTCIYFTFSRGAYLGMAGLLVVGIYFIFKTTKHKIKFSLLLAFASLVAYQVAQIWLFPRFSTVREKASERNYLFEETWRMFEANPIFGTGLGSFSILSPLSNDSPHNDFLAFMVSGGLVGILFLVIFIGLIIFKALRLKIYPELFALLAFVSQALTFNHLIRGRVSVLFWIIVVLIYVGSKSEVVKERVVHPGKRKFKKFKRYRLTW